MPEGDTIHRTAAALRAALIGKATTAFQAPRLEGIVPSPGSVIERVESRGKHLEIGWDDGCVLHTHMRMSGSWHLYRPGEYWRKSSKQMRVVIEVPGWQAVCFSAPVVETYRANAFSRHPVVGSLGPDLAKQDADIAECVARMAQYCEAERTTAEALLDQRVAGGVGNVYKSEVLWACELDPFTPVGALDNAQRTRLIETAASLLRANLETPTRVTATGSPEGLAVYGRFGKPCLRCGSPIEVRKHGEQARVTYWCPTCQMYLPLPERQPGDDDSHAEPRGRRFPWRRKPKRDERAEPGDDATTAAVGQHLDDGTTAAASQHRDDATAASRGGDVGDGTTAAVGQHLDDATAASGGQRLDDGATAVVGQHRDDGATAAVGQHRDDATASSRAQLLDGGMTASGGQHGDGQTLRADAVFDAQPAARAQAYLDRSRAVAARLDPLLAPEA